MALYEVKVITQGVEYYEIEARDDDDAREKFSDGVLTGTETLASRVESVSLQFEDDEFIPGEYYDYDE